MPANTTPGFPSDDIVNVAFNDLCDPPLVEQQSTPDPTNLQLVIDIPVRMTAELGQTHVTIRELLSFAPGSVVELQRLAGEPADLMVNGVLIGKGDVVVVNENYGLRITELISSAERIRKLAR